MRYFLIFFIFFSSLFCYSQGWKSIYRLPNVQSNSPKTIYETTPGNYIAFGTVLDTTNGGLSNKLCVMGLGNHGQLLWTKKYGNSQCYYYDNVFITRWGYKKGNNIYYTCGIKNGSKNNGALLKFDLNGDTLWQRIYRDSTADVAPQRVTGSIDGGFLVTGCSDNGSSRPCFVIKTDADGNKLWHKKIHKAVPDVSDGRAIVQDTATKKIFIGGYQYIGNSNVWITADNILVLDSLGNKLSQSSALGMMGGTIQDLIQTKDKGIVVVGVKTYSLNEFGDDIQRSYISKFDTSNLNSYIWLKEYVGNNQSSMYTCITELANENLAIGGLIDTCFFYGLTPNFLVCVDKRDKNGNLLNEYRYNYKFNNVNSDNNMESLCLNPTSDGGFVSAIETFYYNPDRLFFVKYDSLGCDSTLTYCATIAAGIGTTKLTKQEVSIFPNPVSSYLNIRFENTHGNDLLFATLTDLYGREVKRVQLEQDNFIDVRELAAGLYLIQISNTNKELLYRVKIMK